MGRLDLDTRFEYLIIYRDEEGDKSTWTLPAMSLKMNYGSMVKRGVEVLGVYKKLNSDDLLKEVLNCYDLVEVEEGS